MQSDGLNSSLSPVVYGDIAWSINTIQLFLLLCFLWMYISSAVFGIFLGLSMQYIVLGLYFLYLYST